MSSEQINMDPAGNMDSQGNPEPQTSETAGTGATGAKTADAVLADELREFGKQLEAMFHTARTSPRGQEIQTQLTAAWRDVEKGVTGAITKAQTSDIKGTVAGTAQ